MLAVLVTEVDTVGLGLPAGLLMYATGESDRIEHSVVHAGKRLDITTDHLTGTPAEILTGVARIAGRAKA